MSGLDDCHFEKVAEETGTHPESLMRMLGPKGNPRAGNLLSVIGKLPAGYPVASGGDGRTMGRAKLMPAPGGARAPPVP